MTEKYNQDMKDIGLKRAKMESVIVSSIFEILNESLHNENLHNSNNNYYN